MAYRRKTNTIRMKDFFKKIDEDPTYAHHVYKLETDKEYRKNYYGYNYSMSKEKESEMRILRKRYKIGTSQG